MIPLLSVMALVACQSEAPEAPPPLSVAVEVASTASIASPILTTAVLEAERWQPLYFQQSGLVETIDVSEGDAVTEGQRLATLDLDFQNNQVQLARVSVRAAEQDLQTATRELEQARRIAESGGYSPEQVRDREVRVEDAQLNLERQRLNLRSQRIRLDQMILRAPFDGIVAEMNLRIGDQVRGDVSDPDNDRNSRPPMAVTQPGRFTARFSLPEGQAHEVAVGMTARLSLVEAPDVAFDSTIEWVAPAVDRDSRTVAVRTTAAVGTDHPHHAKVRDGSTVRVEVASGSEREVLTVPEGAVVYHNDQAWLFVTDGATARKIAVTQGRVRAGRVEIDRGLSEGDRVVTTQVYRLVDGQPVRVAEEGP